MENQGRMNTRLAFVLGGAGAKLCQTSAELEPCWLLRLLVGPEQKVAGIRKQEHKRSVGSSSGRRVTALAHPEFAVSPSADLPDLEVDGLVGRAI